MLQNSVLYFYKQNIYVYKKTGRQLELSVCLVIELYKFSFLKNIFQVVCTKYVIRNKSNKIC